MGVQTAPRRWLRRVGIAALIATILLVAALVVARVQWNGPALASFVTGQINQRISGRVKADSIEWSLGSLPGALAGGMLDVEVYGVEVYAAENEGGDLVIKAPYATARLEAHPAMFGNHDLILHDITVPKGGFALIKQVPDSRAPPGSDAKVVSLTSAFQSKPTPTFSAGVHAGSGPIFDLVNYTVDGVDLRFEFEMFTAVARGVTLDDTQPGFLRFDGSDPLAQRFYFSLSPTAEGGTFETGPLAVELRQVEIQRLAEIPSNWPRDTLSPGLEYQATAVTTDGASIDLDGMFKSTWHDYGGEHDVTLKVSSAGDLARRLTGGLVSGDELSAQVTLRGPALGPKLTANVQQAEVTLAKGAGAGAPIADGALPANMPPLELRLPRATAEFDMATNSGTLKDTTLTGAGGEVALSASLNLDPMSFDVTADIQKPLELAPYLPDQVKRLVGSQLSGALHAFGTSEVQRLDNLDLRLGRAHVTGGAYRSKDGKLRPQNLQVVVGKTRLSGIRGLIDTATGTLKNVTFAVRSTDLQRWLGRMGAPPLASSLSGTGRVSGPLTDPRGQVSLDLRGVPVVGKVHTDLRYQDRLLSVDRAQASALGGTLHGQGGLRFGGRLQLVDVRGGGEGIDLGRLPGAEGLVSGTLSIDASASGSVAKPSAEATGHIRGLMLAGDSFADSEIHVASSPSGEQSVSFELQRNAGGVLAADAQLTASGALDGDVSLRSLPLESLTALGGKGKTPVGGQIDADLALSGTPSAPTATGGVKVVGGWFRDTFLGAASLEIERTGPGVVRVIGQLFQGKVEIDGTFHTESPFDVDVTVILRRVEIDHLFPELAAQYAARGWVSGEVRWRGSLLHPLGPRLEATALLTEAVVMIDREDGAGRPAPIRIETTSPLALQFDGTTLTLLDKVVLKGPAGEFALSGQASLETLAFSLTGDISVALLAPYLKRYFDDMSGTLSLDIELAGSAAAPVATGVVAIDEVMVRPSGQDAQVRIPSGRIEIRNDQLSVTGLSMVVVDEWSEGRSELTIAGGVKLESFRPVKWGLSISGDLSGKMLLVVAPTVFSAATGSAELFLALQGDGLAPNIDGEIVFDDETPLAMIPRGLRREVAFTGGIVRFTDKLIEMSADDPLRGWVDDEGQINSLVGEISIDNWRPVDIDVVLNASDLPFRIPQTLELAVNARDLQVVGGMDSGIEVDGVVEIVDGRYIKKFQPFLDALRPERSTETSTPVWETLPLLGDAKLNLLIATRAFYVKNNVADIELNGEVTLRGTPRRPRLEGVIRVEQGTFKFQGVRARFERTRGDVTFSPYRKLPDDTPTLNITTESDYQDISGQQHNILLTLKGPLSQLDWDLSTNTGLNKAQTFTLIFAGRTPDEARAVLGDEPVGDVGVGTTSASTTTSSSSGSLVVADQLLKNLAGDVFSLLMEDSIRNVTGLDVARLELGTSSIGFHGEERLAPSVRLLTDFERSLNGWSWDNRGEYRIGDNTSLEAGWLKKNYDDDAEEDVSDKRIRLIWRKVLLP